MTSVSRLSHSILLICLLWCVCISSLLASNKIQLSAKNQLMPYAISPIQQLSMITEQSPPGGYLDANGKVTGATVDLVRILGERLNENISIDVLPWARALEMAKKQSNIGLFETIRSTQRESWFQWVGPLKIYQISLYGRSNTTHHKITPEELPGRLVACANRGSDYVNQIESLGFKQGINLVLTVNEDNCAHLMLQGKVDLAPYNENSILEFSKTLGLDTEVIPVLPLGEVRLYLAFSKDVAGQRVLKWQQALEKSYTDGTMRSLYEGIYSEKQIRRLENIAQH